MNAYDIPNNLYINYSEIYILLSVNLFSNGRFTVEKYVLNC